MTRNAAQSYGNVAKQTAKPRELEASLLLKAAARFQAIRDGWDGKQRDLDDALLYNRKLWCIFLASVTSKDNPMSAELRQNIANLGVFVLSQSHSLSTDRRPERLGSLITVNRELAAGLMAQA